MALEYVKMNGNAKRPRERGCVELGKLNSKFDFGLYFFVRQPGKRWHYSVVDVARQIPGWLRHAH